MPVNYLVFEAKIKKPTFEALLKQRLWEINY